MYDIHEIRKDFPVLEKVIYLDNGATSQTPVPAVEAMCEYFYSYAANHGRGAHRLARETTNRYEDARQTVAQFLGAGAKNVVFTKNTTESINMVAQGFGFAKGDHIITTLIEHHSNLLPWMKLRDIGVDVTIVRPDRSGIVQPEAIGEAIQDNTKLITVTHISNVLGSIQDVGRIVRIAKEHGIATLIDAAQSAGHMELDVRKLGCDFLAAPGHKGLLGPQGTGVLYMKEPESVQPLFLGGGTVHSVTTEAYILDDYPSRFEAGTPNIPGVIGLGRAVEYVKAIGVADIEKHELSLARDAAQRLSEIDNVEVYGPKERGSAVPFNVVGLNPHDVAMILDEVRTICVRSGHHCAIPTIGFLDVDGTVRATFGLYNTQDEVDALVDMVGQIATSLV